MKRLATVPTGDEGGSGKDGNRADREVNQLEIC